MSVLLDTHVLVWWAEGDRRLGPEARVRATSDERASLVSPKELATKHATGRFVVDVDAIAGLLRLTDAPVVGITLDHVLGVAELPLHHRDPFDRLLLAQARHEQMPIMSADPALAASDVEVVDPRR